VQPIALNRKSEHKSKKSKKKQSHEKCDQQYQMVRCHGESQTKNHSHSSRCVCSTTMTVLVEWQTWHFIQTMSLLVDL